MLVKNFLEKLDVWEEGSPRGFLKTQTNGGRGYQSYNPLPMSPYISAAKTYQAITCGTLPKLYPRNFPSSVWFMFHSSDCLSTCIISLDEQNVSADNIFGTKRHSAFLSDKVIVIRLTTKKDHTQNILRKILNALYTHLDEV